MILGYNTNGFAFHDPLQAIDILGEIGYRSLAITVDHAWLNPNSSSTPRQLEEIQARLDRWSMDSVIETGARFLLDPKRKHEPTLVSADAGDRQRRTEFLYTCIDYARHLGSHCVSIWSGFPDDFCDTQTALDRLAAALQPVVEYAAEQEVVLGFEPEPGMFVETTAQYERLCRWIESDNLKLTMDVGHLFCLGEIPLAGFIHRFKNNIVNVHIEDMKVGKHEHLAFGEGDISFPPVLKAFKEIEYQGPIHVELSRHSHNAVEVARHAFQFLQTIIKTDLQSSF